MQLNNWNLDLGFQVILIRLKRVKHSISQIGQNCITQSRKCPKIRIHTADQLAIWIDFTEQFQRIAWKCKNYFKQKNKSLLSLVICHIWMCGFFFCSTSLYTLHRLHMTGKDKKHFNLKFFFQFWPSNSKWDLTGGKFETAHAAGCLSNHSDQIYLGQSWENLMSLAALAEIMISCQAHIKWMVEYESRTVSSWTKWASFWFDSIHTLSEHIHPSDIRGTNIRHFFQCQVVKQAFQ